MRKGNRMLIIPYTKFFCPFCKNLIAAKIGHGRKYSQFPYGPECKKCSNTLPTGAKNWKEASIFSKIFHSLAMTILIFLMSVLLGTIIYIISPILLIPLLFMDLPLFVLDRDLGFTIYFFSTFGVGFLIGFIFFSKRYLHLLNSSYENKNLIGALDYAQFYFSLVKYREEHYR